MYKGLKTACDALCRGFDSCRRRARDVAVDFCPKPSGWLINQLYNPVYQTRMEIFIPDGDLKCEAHERFIYMWFNLMPLIFSMI